MPTAGQGVPSAFNPIRPETVLVAVTPSAPPVKKTCEHLSLDLEERMMETHSDPHNPEFPSPKCLNLIGFSNYA